MKSIVITGVSSGIGLETARLFLHKGWRVFGSVRNSEDADVLSVHSSFRPLVFDVRDHDAVLHAGKEVAELLDGSVLDVLVNNAGIAVYGPLIRIPIEEVHKQLDVNVLGVLRTSQAFAPLLSPRTDSGPAPGRIINIGSVSGRFALPMLGPYSASKFALQAVSDSMRRELLIYDIPVSIIDLASTHSAIWNKAREAETHTSGTPFEAVDAMKEELIARSEQKAISTEKVAQFIYKVGTTKNPRPRYLVTRNNLALSAVLALPDRWVDKWILASFRKAMARRNTG